MCGGAGTRLWPASREGRPKQFLPLFGPHSTFQETLRRVGDPGMFGRPIIVTNHQYRFMVAEQLAEIGVEADILLEPARRDSGPAIVAGAIFAFNRGGDAVVVALAADHVVSRSGRLRQSLRYSWRERRRAIASSPSVYGPTARRPIWIYPPGRFDRLRHICDREIRREARRKDRGALRCRWLFVEFRQFFVSRQLSPRRIPRFRAAERGGSHRVGRRCQQRSRLCYSSMRKRSRARRQSRSITR